MGKWRQSVQISYRISDESNVSKKWQQINREVATYMIMLILQECRTCTEQPHTTTHTHTHKHAHTHTPTPTHPPTPPPPHPPPPHTHTHTHTHTHRHTHTRT